MTERREDMHLSDLMGMLKMGEEFARYEKLRPLDEESAVGTINTASKGLVLLTSLVSQALHDAEIRPGESLDDVADAIHESREVMGEARKTVAVVDDSFGKLSEDEQVERVFAVFSSDFMYIRR